MKIQRLKLFSAHLQAQFEFYTETLGLDLIGESNNSFSIRIGNSELVFEEAQDFHPYHFAVNIPSHNESEALNFIKDRTSALKHEETEIIDYENWNAKAIYFYDADKNLVELISRNNLAYPKSETFDKLAFIEISEIGLPTSDIEKEFKILNQTCGLEIYDGNFERFCAIGDEQGLFICVNKDLKTWFPTNEKAFPSKFELLLEEKTKVFKCVFDGKDLAIITPNS